MTDVDNAHLVEDAADPDEAKPSRSQIKRDHLALQVLAEQLLALPRDLLQGLSLGESTWAAIDETARIKDRRALRRHYKRIANCLARENTEPLQSLLDQRAAQDRQAVALQHQAERWRERLLEQGDDALAELIDAFPEIDRQQLRSLVRAARRDAERDRPDAPRRLFRFIRGVLESGPTD
jgi:ribosome-associated protein